MTGKRRVWVGAAVILAAAAATGILFVSKGLNRYQDEGELTLAGLNATLELLPEGSGE